MGSLRQKVLAPWVIMPLVAMLALGGWFVLRPEGSSAGTTTTTAATEQVVAATSGTMAQTVTAEGTVASAQTDELSFASSGTVTAVDVAAGDTVKAGQVLATIDSAELASAVTDAEASLADAEANLSDDTDAGATDEQLEADQATITSAQDSLDSAYEALAGAELVATFDGTVASVDLTVGEQLGSAGTGGTTATGSDSGSGQSAGNLGSSSPSQAGADAGSTTAAQISVISTGSFTVDLGFDDTDIGQLEVGQLASLTLSTSTSSSQGFGFPGGGGFPGAALAERAAAAGSAPTSAAQAAPAATGNAVTGLVTEVGKVADASSGVASYPVTVAFIDTSGDFNVGATVSAAITYAEVEDAVQVPSRAVTTGTDGTSTVTVDTDGKRGTRTVTTGLTANGMVQIVAGLKAGESVVMAFPGRGQLPGGANGGGPAVVTNGAGG